MPKGRGQFFKKAHQELEYNIDQIQELEKCSKDPVYFIKTYIRIQHPTKGNVSFELYPFQERIIKEFVNHRKNIVLAARQVGKSTISAAYLLWFASFNFDKTILIASNKEANAIEMIEKIMYMYEYLPDWLKPGIMPDQCNKHGMGFDNKSRIISTATSENSGRGLSISLLFLDEFAFVNKTIQEKFWTSIAPTLAQGGSCIIASTPNGDSDIFSTLWRSAELKLNDFNSIHIKWDESPGRDEAFKNQQIAEIGFQKFQQEYMCVFLSSDSLLIDSLILSNLTPLLKNERPLAIKNDIWFFREAKQDGMYIVSVDPSEGGGNDYTVIEVFELDRMEQIIEYRSNTKSSMQSYTILKQIINYIESKGGEVYFSIENNGIGQGIISIYENDENPPENAIFISDEGKDKKGVYTDGKNKIRSCFVFKEMLERGKLIIHSLELLKELKSFVQTKSSFKAQSGSTDDCVSACLIAIRILEQIAKYDETAYNKLYSSTSIPINSLDKINGEEGDSYSEDDDDQFMPIVL